MFPSLLAPKDCFVRKQVFHKTHGGDGFSIREYYLYCVLYFYYLLHCICNEVIIQLTIRQNQIISHQLLIKTAQPRSLYRTAHGRVCTPMRIRCLDDLTEAEPRR